ncbi:MAG: class I SAM-dependent methyltransferase [Bryobacteraceae bacterium]|nr:class I SAM-dependent methyltransferase [Bryobacteraceae bacterium]
MPLEEYHAPVLLLEPELPPAPPAKPPESCPACGNAGVRVLYRAGDRLYRTTSDTFEIVECQSCRLVRLSPRPTPAELCRYYPKEYWYVPAEDAASRLTEAYRRFVLRDHVRFVEKAIAHAPANGLVVDVGCGGGLFLRLLKDRGYKVVGIDFSLAAAGFAWEHNKVPAICGSLSSAPLPAESCAVITMFHVLEHLFDPASNLQSAHNLLHPEGRLVVQVPNAASWQFLLLGENWSGADVPRHLWNFRARDLEILLDRCGFEVARVKYFSLRDNPACLATSLAPGLDPMVRRIRGTNDAPRRSLVKDVAYFSLVAASLPFALLEAACRAGSTVMMEARKKR